MHLVAAGTPDLVLALHFYKWSRFDPFMGAIAHLEAINPKFLEQFNIKQLHRDAGTT